MYKCCYGGCTKSYIDDWNLSTSTTQRNAIRYNMKQKFQQSLIEAFANEQILPKYGFPIDVKSLQVISGYTNADTKPFAFEGTARMKIAMNGIKELSSHVDSLITIPNDKLLDVYGLVEAAVKNRQDFAAHRRHCFPVIGDRANRDPESAGAQSELALGEVRSAGCVHRIWRNRTGQG